MFEKIRKLIAEQLNMDEEKITMDSRVIEDLGADSLDMVEMLMTLEDEFDVRIPEDASNSMNTVGDLVKFIENECK